MARQHNKALFDYYGDIAPLKGWIQPEDMRAINQDGFPPPAELIAL